MSEDFVNNITLNYLISKTQLNKLNKAKQVKENHVKNEKELYKEQIMALFCELLEDSSSVNVLQEVKNGFDYFIDKTIYHIKMKKITEDQEENRNKNEPIIVTKSRSSSSCDDNNKEDEENEEDEDDEHEHDEDELDDKHEQDCTSKQNDIFHNHLEKDTVVYKKYPDKFNWFNMVKNEKKSNKIVPRVK
jgi:hypothetical protein